MADKKQDSGQASGWEGAGHNPHQAEAGLSADILW